MKTFQSGWYLIYTRPRHEKKVHAYLSDQKITSFLPLTKKVSVRNDRKRVVDEPMFPSYLFVYLNNIDSYYTSVDAEGSLYYVREGKKIVCVDESIISDIKLVSCNAADVEVSDRRFQPGQRTVINEGALSGLSCEIIRIGSKQKLLVRIELLQRSLLISLPQESLVAV